MIEFKFNNSEDKYIAYLLAPSEITSVPLTHYILSPLTGIYLKYFPEEIKVYLVPGDIDNNRFFPVGHFLLALPAANGIRDVEAFGYIRACRIQGWDV